VSDPQDGSSVDDHSRVLEDHSKQAKISSWNINYISEKRSDLETYLRSSKIDILLLQETWRMESNWPLRIKGYSVFESCATGTPGQNGLAILVRDSLVAYEIGTVNPYTLAVKVALGKDEWTIINLYIPPANNINRKEAIRTLKASIAEVFGRQLITNVIVAGDWNMNSEKAIRWLRRLRFPIMLPHMEGDDFTFYRGGRWSALDHMAVCESVVGLVSTRVNTS
jgi:hypothetical protein